MEDEKILLQVDHLVKRFKAGRGHLLTAVNDISFEIPQKKTLGLVGESGCGKSTVGRTILRLYEKDGGQVLFDGTDVHAADARTLRELNRRMQIVFQDPYASLDPRYTVTDVIAEGMDNFGLYTSRKERQEKVYELLSRVGLHKEHSNRFPHEFSGGQRQRLGIARALAVDPEFIVCDEAISALDVSVQAQVINLLIDLQEQKGLTYLFISHDLSMVRHISDRIAVMYLGSVVELGSSDDVYYHALHPYSRALLSAVPVASPRIERNRQRIILQGNVPSPIDLPPGCPFAGRCPYAKDRCREEKPELRELENHHFAACHFVENL